MKQELYETLVDGIVDGVLEIGNNKHVMKICEPNIMNPLKLDRWMIYRTLTSYAALVGELKEQAKAKKD